MNRSHSYDQINQKSDQHFAKGKEFYFKGHKEEAFLYFERFCVMVLNLPKSKGFVRDLKYEKKKESASKAMDIMERIRKERSTKAFVREPLPNEKVLVLDVSSSSAKKLGFGDYVKLRKEMLDLNDLQIESVLFQTAYFNYFSNRNKYDLIVFCDDQLFNETPEFVKVEKLLMGSLTKPCKNVNFLLGGLKYTRLLKVENLDFAEVVKDYVPTVSRTLNYSDSTDSNSGTNISSVDIPLRSDSKRFMPEPSVLIYPSTNAKVTTPIPPMIPYKPRDLDSLTNDFQSKLTLKKTILTPAIPPKPLSLTLPEFQDLNLCGLQNIGNTCFMNSVLQSLVNTSPFSHYYASQQSTDPVVIMFQRIIQQTTKGEITERDLKSFKLAVAKEYEQYESYEQHDAHEFFCSVLDLLESPVIAYLFQGLLTSTLRCTICNTKSSSESTFTDLSLPVPTASNSLEFCFKLFLTVEILDGDNQWICTKCKQPRKSTKSLFITKLPPILIIHLNRFAGSLTLSKNKTLIKCADRLDMKALCGIDGMYELYCVVNHYGDMSGGHYTCLMKDRRGWWCFDDKNVKEVIGEVVGSEAYMVFYRRVR